MKRLVSWTILAGMVLLCGCAGKAPSDDSHRPIGIQMLQAAPELAGHRFSNLLDFESKSDAVFVSTTDLSAVIDSKHHHTGSTSLRLSSSGDGGKATVKLASLMGTTQAFPNRWTLAGAYFYTEKPAQIQVTFDFVSGQVSQSMVKLTPGRWTTVMADVAHPRDLSEPANGAAAIHFQLPAAGEVWCDDLVLIDNTQWIVGGEESARMGAWSVCRKGLKIVCSNPERFTLRLTPADVSIDGWQLAEASAMRARFTSTGMPRLLTIYPDGRSYQDGEYRPLATELRGIAFWERQHIAPAQIDLPESLGRLNRTSDGDANNDGYNEARASYMVTAQGPRLAITLTPRSATLIRPLIEISGLPMGDALVTIEGRLIEKKIRLDDGTLLIEIPGQIDRPTSLNIRVQ